MRLQACELVPEGAGQLYGGNPLEGGGWARSGPCGGRNAGMKTTRGTGPQGQGRRVVVASAKGHEDVGVMPGR